MQNTKTKNLSYEKSIGITEIKRAKNIDRYKAVCLISANTERKTYMVVGIDNHDKHHSLYADYTLKTTNGYFKLYTRRAR